MGMEAAEEEVAEERIDPSSRDFTYLKAAFLAMEPAGCFISLASWPLQCMHAMALVGYVPHSAILKCGGGSLTTGLQNFILEHCINCVVGKTDAPSHTYIKNILKKVIVAAESCQNVVLEDLYEQYAYYITSLKEDDLLRGNTKIHKYISFLFPDECSRSMNLVMPIQCSLDMFEGDTGCAIWPSSLFLSEFILSYPELFRNKCCFEVGAGAGLVGISLKNVKASKVILSDGDLSTLANLKVNLQMNQISTRTEMSQRTSQNTSLVECRYLPWESASERELQSYQPDIVLGADVIYDPSCLPHLVRVLSALLTPKKMGISHSHEKTGRGENTDGFSPHQREEIKDDFSHGKLASDEHKGIPTAYIATVIRNVTTFNYFCDLVDQAHLSIVDSTEKMKPLNLLPYMHSYDRGSIKLFVISYLQN